jgi:surface protein
MSNTNISGVSWNDMSRIMGVTLPPRTTNDNSSSIEWQRPSDWLPMPTVVDTDQTFVGLYAIHPNGNNFAAFRFTTNTGRYQVDWGDGTVDLVNSNVIAQHTYNYDIYDPTDTTLSSRGYKQAIIVVTPVTGNLLTANFQLRRTTTPAQNQPYATGFLDCILSMPNANTGASILFGGFTVNHRYCEQFSMLNSGMCTSINSMFQSCTALQSVPLLDTSNVIDMSFMFNSCQSLQTIPLLNTSNVTNMNSMFAFCSLLQTIPLLNTSNVTNMSNMIQGCTALQSVPLLNTSNVTNMSAMFSGCSSLQTIPLFNTANVTNMNSMFQSCTALQTMPLLNTSNVTIMSAMFSGCQSLQTIPLLNTSNVTNMSTMFATCRALQSVPLLETSNVTNMSTMFPNCQSLQSIPALSTAAITTTTGTDFTNFAPSCNSLDRIEMIFARSTNMTNSQLSRDALVEIFNNLTNRSATTAANINISGNWGALAGGLSSADRAIATGKNWTITG